MSSPASEAAPSTAAPAPAQQAPTSAKSEADEAEFTTLEQAEAAMERARADLDRLALLDRRDSTADKAPGAPPPPAAAATRSSGAGADMGRAEAKRVSPKPSAPAKGAAEAPAAAPATQPADDAEGESAPGNPCDTGCKAFASLLRAKAAVCRLDSPGGSRCTRAEDIAREAEGRVRSCSCRP
ncbi:MAG: hypothetical protein QM756_46295 [Polyangiaceae bacterium]